MQTKTERNELRQRRRSKGGAGQRISHVDPGEVAEDVGERDDADHAVGRVDAYEAVDARTLKLVADLFPERRGGWWVGDLCGLIEVGDRWNG